MQSGELLENLKHIGLNEKESLVYLAGLELGEAAVQDIAKVANIKRPTVYRLIEDLEKRGLFSVLARGKKNYYVAEDPETIFNLYKTRQDAFARLLPQLQLVHNKGRKKPRVRFYHGLEGLKAMYLESLKAKETIVGYGSIDEIFSGLSRKFVDDYMKERIKRKIRVRGIVPSSPESQAFAKLNQSQMREIVLLPKDKFKMTNEINIYDDKVAIFSFREQVGVIVESQDIADSQKAIFELAWQGAHIL